MKQVILAFVALILVLVFGFITMGFGVKNAKSIPLNLFTINAAVKRTDITLGAEKNLSLLAKNIKWTPDGHITYVTFPNGNRRFFLSGNQRTYSIDSSTPLSLEEVLSKNSTVKENFGPDENISYRNKYSTISSVVQTEPKNLYHLFAFTQNEEQLKKPNGSYDFANFTSSIGLLESFDGGTTWKDFGPVIRGDDYLTPGIKITGAGEPSAIIKDGYIYVYFVDWAAQIKTKHPDQIYLARTKIFPDGGLGAFEYYNADGFSTDTTNMQSVIKLPDAENTGYAALPSISYNKYLNQYLAVFETNIGFYQVFSIDGINWTQEKLILSFTKPQSTRASGDVWVSYPTLLSDQTEKFDGSTENKGNLYFASGIWPNTAHQLTLRSFEFK
jgi:hypothetical protein